MNILIRNYYVKANINHVYFCFSDIDHLYKEFTRLANNKTIKIIKHNQEIEFKGERTIFKLKLVEFEKPNYFSAEITPAKKMLNTFGKAKLTCNFKNNGEYTKVSSVLTSEKNPSLFWKIFIKIIVFILVFQSRKNEKQYICAIEKNA